MEDVYLVGVSMTPFGKFLDMSVKDLTRAAVGEGFLLVYRLSMLDLVPGGSSWAEVVQLADGGVRNGYTLKVLNKLHVDRRLELSRQVVGPVDRFALGFCGLAGIDDLVAVNERRFAIAPTRQSEHDSRFR